jgi:hypothetical protein
MAQSKDDGRLDIDLLNAVLARGIPNIVYLVHDSHSGVYALSCHKCGINTKREDLKNGATHPTMSRDALRTHLIYAHREAKEYSLPPDAVMSLCKGQPIPVDKLRLIAAGGLTGPGELLEPRAIPREGEMSPVYVYYHCTSTKHPL